MMNKFKMMCITSLFCIVSFLFSALGHAAQQATPLQQDTDNPPTSISFLAKALNISVDSGELNDLKAQAHALEKRWGSYHCDGILYAVGYYFWQSYKPIDPEEQALPHRLSVARNLVIALEQVGTQSPPLSSYQPYPYNQTPSYWALFYTINTYLPEYSVADHRTHFNAILSLFHDLEHDYDLVLASLSWANQFFDRNHHSINTFLDLARACCRSFNPHHFGRLLQTHQEYQQNPWDPQHTLQRLRNALEPPPSQAAAAA